MRKKTAKRFIATWLVLFIVFSNVFLAHPAQAGVQAVEIVFPGTGLIFTLLEKLKDKLQEKIKGEINDIKDELTTPDKVGSQGMSGTNRPMIPNVKVKFSSDGVVTDGSKLTAEAIADGFFNTDPNQKPYYTWYLKRSGCGLSKDVDSGNKKCDLDDDGKITVNDWKIAAARIIVRGDYDPTDKIYLQSKDGDGDNGGGYVPYPSIVDPKVGPSKGKKTANWTRSYDDSLDSKNQKSRDDDFDDVPNCYVYEKESGLTYELRSPGIKKFEECENGYHRACVKTTDASASCLVNDPNNPGGPQIPAADLKMCKVSVEDDPKAEDPTKSNIMTCGGSAGDISELANFKLSAHCSDGGEALCVPDDGSIMSIGQTKDNVNTDSNAKYPVSTQDLIFNNKAGFVFGSKTYSESEICTDRLLKPIDPATTTPPYWGVQYGSCENTIPLFNAKTVNGVSEFAPSCITIKEQLKQRDSSNLCKHLFPVVPKKDQINGDGKFTQDEQDFWGTNPNTKSTNGVNLDEEATTGFGIDKFTWTYVDGDQIGVAVEGSTAIPTEHNDGSYKIMWAFSKNKCKAITSLKDGGGNFYIESKANDPKNPYVGKNQIGILTADVDLNDCLEENLINPSDEAEVNMDVSVEISPENPLNNVSEINEENKVSAVATVNNVDDTSGLYYEWKVEISSDGTTPPTEDTKWVDVTSDMKSLGSFVDGSEQGIGKENFDFNLNLPDSILNDNGVKTSDGAFYLRVKTYVSDYSGQAESMDTAKGVKEFKVKKQGGGQIKVFSSTASSDGMLSVNNEICTDTKIPCSVAANEIIALNVPNINNELEKFSWKVNDKEVFCNSKISSLCDKSGSANLFFPAQGAPESVIEVSASAVNNKTKEIVNIDRKFVIGASGLKISTADENVLWPKLLGTYTDQNGNKTAEYSQDIFEAYQGGDPVKFTASASPAFKEDSLKFFWTINGEKHDEFDGKKEISVETTGNEAGDVINIELLAKTITEENTQVANIKKALLKNWGIVMDESDDPFAQTVVAGAQVELLDGSDGAVASKNSSIFNASLITHLPEQAMFLLRILLTVTLLLVSAGVVFAFIPGARNER
jgi:hypothetical protein